MGHIGTMLGAALWAVDLRTRVDYGTRSTHVTAVASKAIIERFYGRTAAFSYFRGCSTGGREGLGEAQHSPEDFDGIIAGDPAFAGRLGAFANNWDSRQLLTRGGTAGISSREDKTSPRRDPRCLRRIGRPERRHHLRPAPVPLRCEEAGVRAGHDEPTCLSAAQVASAERIYDGARNSHGERLFPGHLVYGSEAAWSGEYVATLTDSYLKYMVNPSPNPTTYSHWEL